MDAEQRTARRRRIVRLRSWGRPMLAAYESRLSGRLFAVGMVGGSVFALATGTPPWVPLICLIAWPLASAILCGIYLAISVLELRLWRTVGLGAGLALHLLFLSPVTIWLMLLMYPELWSLPP